MWRRLMRQNGIALRWNGSNPLGSNSLDATLRTHCSRRLGNSALSHHNFFDAVAISSLIPIRSSSGFSVICYDFAGRSPCLVMAALN